MIASDRSRQENPRPQSAAPCVLHVVENLNRGAAENWLLRMFRFAVESGIAVNWTFYCALGAKGKLDDEVRKLGGRIVYSPVPIGEKVAFMFIVGSVLITPIQFGPTMRIP